MPCPARPAASARRFRRTRRGRRRTCSCRPLRPPSPSRCRAAAPCPSGRTSMSQPAILAGRGMADAVVASAHRLGLRHARCPPSASTSARATDGLADLDILDLAVRLDQPGLDAVVVVDRVDAADLAQARPCSAARSRSRRWRAIAAAAARRSSRSRNRSARRPCRGPARRCAPCASCGRRRARRRRA